ncbi:MAG: non-canonical purine NTP phosphatase [Bacteroidetes bacterium]|nr:MAG: non-canonical purine NTP phosphatase [Bacteroidota bacterium]
MHLIVASKNPVKIEAARRGFAALFPDVSCQCEGIGVPSDVADQPFSEEETLTGARNRAGGARAARPEADLWIGIEGGVAPMDGGLGAFAWIVVEGKEQKGQARTATFMLPPPVAVLLSEGLELGEADDRIFGQENSKQVNGAIGLLTHDAIVRETLYRPAVIMALIPFYRPELYPVVD